LAPRGDRARRGWPERGAAVGRARPGVGGGACRAARAGRRGLRWRGVRGIAVGGRRCGEAGRGRCGEGGALVARERAARALAARTGGTGKQVARGFWQIERGRGRGSKLGRRSKSGGRRQDLWRRPPDTWTAAARGGRRHRSWRRPPDTSRPAGHPRQVDKRQNCWRRHTLARRQ
jgi:hypothetical protein